VPFLIAAAQATGRPAFVFGTSVFALTLVLLYLASTLYHAWPTHKGKRLLQLLDHIAIYLLIAGTYTPFSLGVLWGGPGWSLLALVWGLAIVGIVLKCRGGLKHQIASTLLYLLMGWSVLLVLGPLCQAMPAAGLGWLIAGGLAYTFGVVFYIADRIHYAHFVWHLFVLVGSGCHIAAVMSSGA
jgi:hemolysin III